MKTTRLLHAMLSAGLLCTSVSYGQAQSPATVPIFERLQQFDSLVVGIETDLKQLEAGKAEERWQPAVFKVMAGDSAVLRMNIQIAARGKTRKENCDFPPVKIRFYSQKPENDSIADINELKLVTSCNATPKNEKWVQREYLLYELYNLVTEQSFRVKSANVYFADTGKKGRKTSSFSFFIESEEELAARLHGRPMKPRVGSTRTLDSVSYDRMCLFEFMIGNTDWSARARHNIKLIYLNPSNSVIAIPYDFDYSGAVGTDYAVPNGDYPIETVKDRYYLGMCRTAAHYRQLFDFYLSREAAILEHIEKAPYLSAYEKKQVANYLDDFFTTLRDPRLAKRDILNNCNKGR